MTTFVDTHRGPWRLCVTRPTSKVGSFRTEWLKGEVDRDDLFAEAQSLLDDPRDTIVSVNFWSVTEGCFTGGIKK